MSRTVCGICWCPYDDDTGACACEPELKAQHMTDLRTAAQQALEALELGYDSAKAEADQYHAAMAGYRPQRHAEMDADVQKIARAITALRAALAEPVQQGCDHCSQPLYAAVKCRVCGRVTEPVQEPVWVCPDSAEHRYQKPGHCEDCGKTLVQERNFCPRCGKRALGIHTCTPPGDCDVHG